MRRFLLIAILLIVAPALAPASDVVELTGSYWYVVDHITQVDEDARVRLWMSLPGDRPGQDVRIRNVSPRPTEILVDEVTGGQIAYWDLAPQTGDKILLVHCDFNATLSRVEFEVDPDAIQPYDTESAVYRHHTAASELIPTDGEIAAVARRIAGTDGTPWHQARRLFDWMVEHLEFVPGGIEGQGTLGTLQSRQGDCGQFSRLFTAMCRSLGIPARTVTTYWLSGGRHRRAEFLLPPYGWLPVDIASAQVLLPGHSYFSPAEARLFAREKDIPHDDPGWLCGNASPSQIALAVGSDLDLESPEGLGSRYFSILEPGGDLAEPTGVIIQGLGDEYVPGGFISYGPVLSDDEAHDMAHQKLVSRFLNKGLYDVAEQGCLQMQQNDPDGVTSWMNLGLVRLRKGEYDAAEACFNRALRGHAWGRMEKLESVIWTHNYLGNCYDLMGRREMALAQYAEVVELDNDYRGAVVYARTYLGRPFAVGDFR